MSVDFFKEDCHKTSSEKRFGICDDDNKEPAYLDSSINEGKWIATVKNDTPKEISFRAIDNCIEVLRENGEMESRCDVMMTYDNTIIFVELKNKRTDWISEGIAQIEAGLITFINHNAAYYYSFKKKKAFVANRRHPNFHELENETMKRFFKQYKIRLDVQAEIVIK